MSRLKIQQLFFMPLAHGYDFYWGRQCSWTLTPANSMQVSSMQFDNCNRKQAGVKQGYFLLQQIFLGEENDATYSR